MPELNPERPIRLFRPCAWVYNQGRPLCRAANRQLHDPAQTSPDVLSVKATSSVTRNAATTRRLELEGESATSDRLSVPDNLTLRRLLLLVTGLAVGMALFTPETPVEGIDAEYWWHLWGAIVIGLSMPAPLFALSRTWRGHRLGIGGVYALAIGLGVWLLLPPAISVALRQDSEAYDSTAYICMLYVPALMSLWMVLALGLGRRLRVRYLGPGAAWTERYGFYLAFVWLPLGLRLMWLIYNDDFR